MRKLKLSSCPIPNHMKIYYGDAYMIMPPLYPWICKICGANGKDHEINGEINRENFDRLSTEYY